MIKVDWDAVFETQPILETTRCRLRPVTTDDAPFILHLMGDPDVTQYLGRHPLPDLESAQQSVNKYASQFDAQTGMVWLICRRDDDTIMGNCLIFNLLKDHYRAEIGYALVPEWWGIGIMSEVLPVALDFAFDSMHLHSLYGQIDPENKGSRQLLEKFGFVQEAYYQEDFYHPVHQKFTDTAILSLLKSGWENYKNQST